MKQKIMDLITKIEAVVHGAITAVQQATANLNSVERIAGAVIIAGFGLDLVTVGHFGVISFLFSQLSALRDIVLDFAKAGTSGVILAFIGYLVYKETKAK